MEPMKLLSAETTQDRMTVSVQVLTFPDGIYAFLVRSSLPAKAAVDHNLLLPAVHVARGPDTGPGDIEFLSGLRGRPTWLRDAGDVVVAKVTGGPVSVLLTSMRVPGAPALALEIQRVDASSILGPTIALDREAASDAGAPARTAIVPKITVHVRNRGDLSFAGEDLSREGWAGLPGQRLWIESFAVEPPPPLEKGDVEYKGLTASGFETP